MPKYRFGYYVVEEWSGFFTAESDEAANKLIEQLKNDEITTDELENYEERNHNIESDFSESWPDKVGD